ncbi:MAG: addiction module toxin, HicA family [Methanosarcinales archaeon]|nr:MAG: addiction module toxin, HicA family [Methanosarcinales archaeon]
MPTDYSKLRNITAREIISALSRDGFCFRSQTGSHQRYGHPWRKSHDFISGSGRYFSPKNIEIDG